MREQIAEILESSLLDILSSYALAFGDRKELHELEDRAEEFVCSQMDFLGDGQSCLTIAVSKNLANELTANILGTDATDPVVEARYEDTMNEFMNVFCGHLRPIITSEDSEYSESLPATKHIERAEWNRMIESENALGFEIEDEPLVLIFSLVR